MFAKIEDSVKQQERKVQFASYLFRWYSVKDATTTKKVEAHYKHFVHLSVYRKTI